MDITVETISTETLSLCLELLKSVTLQVGHPDFATKAPQTVNALRELEAELVQRGKWEIVD